ncbi:MAG TPA: VWA domain-containing protein [Pyrinomonadaceae bacterium]|nr:VWA domain-containing protein [Pyrinomonadaceae bacterium]
MRDSTRQHLFFKREYLQLFFALLSALLFVSSRAQEPQDDDVVRVNTDLVVLNATVLDGAGKYVHGLRRSDFEVFEDTREQTISHFSTEETPFAAAVLLDTSGSMEQRLTMARSAAIRFLDGLREEDVAAVYHFDSEVEQIQEFSSSRDLAPLAFGLRAKGMTVLYDAILRAAADLAQRPEKRRAIVVLSDGADTRSGATADKALTAALAAHATIYTVDMSLPNLASRERHVAAAALRNFAGKSGGRYVSTPGGQALRDAFASIVEELGNQYTIGYQPTNRARDGRWRAIDLKLKRADLTARTRKGYKASKN